MKKYLVSGGAILAVTGVTASAVLWYANSDGNSSFLPSESLSASVLSTERNLSQIEVEQKDSASDDMGQDDDMPLAEEIDSATEENSAPRSNPVPMEKEVCGEVEIDVAQALLTTTDGKTWKINTAHPESGAVKDIVAAHGKKTCVAYDMTRPQEDEKMVFWNSRTAQPGKGSTCGEVTIIPQQIVLSDSAMQRQWMVQTTSQSVTDILLGRNGHKTCALGEVNESRGTVSVDSVADIS